MADNPNQSDLLDKFNAQLILDSTEFSYIEDVVAGTRTAEKAIVVDASGTIDALDIDALSLVGVAVTSTATELNLLDGVSGLLQSDFTKLAALTASAAELNKMDGVTATPAELNLVDNKLAGATIVVAADAGTTVAITVQFTDAAGADMATPVAVKWYYSSDALGLDPLGTAHDGGTAIGSDGALIETVADLSGLMISEADGDVDLVVTVAGAFSAYLVLVIKDALVISDEIVHDA